MDDTGRVNVFQTSEDLVEEVLDKLLLEWTRGEESVKIGTEELSDEVAEDVSMYAFRRVYLDGGVYWANRLTCLREER